MATTSLARIGGVGIAGVIAVAVVVMLMAAALILTTIVSAMAAAALTRIGRVGVPSVIAMAVVTMFLAAGLTTIARGVSIGVARTSIGRPCITAVATSAAPSAAVAAPSAAVAASAALVVACAAVAAFLTATPLTFAGTAILLALAAIAAPGRVRAGRIRSRACAGVAIAVRRRLLIGRRRSSLRRLGWRSMRRRLRRMMAPLSITQWGARSALAEPRLEDRLKQSRVTCRLAGNCRGCHAAKQRSQQD